MASQKNLYIRDEDTLIWDVAERIAKDERRSLSSLVTSALRHYLPDDIKVVIRAEDDPNYDPGEVEVFDERGTPLLVYGHHQEQDGLSWKLWYPELDGNGVEDYLIGSTGYVGALTAAREHLALIKVGRAVEEITVEVGDKDDRRWNTSFVGRWLVDPDDDNRFGHDAGACYGVAQTRKNKIAVYKYHVNDLWSPSLDVYDDLEEAARENGWADEIIALLAAELGEKYTVRLDI